MASTRQNKETMRLQIANAPYNAPMVQQDLFRDYPALVRRITIGIVGAALFGLIGWRIAAVTAPPPLALTTPAHALSTSSRIITVSGHTAPGAALTINGEVFAPDASGAFTTHIVLLPGVNTVAIEARRRHSRPARIERIIEVQRNDAPLADLP